MKLCGVAQKWRDHREAAKNPKVLVNFISFNLFLFIYSFGQNWHKID